MKLFFYLQVFVFFAIPCLAYSNESLEQKWKQEILSPYSGFNRDVLADLSKKHVITVDGIMNELSSWVGNYFNDNLREMSNLNMSHDHLRFSSRIAVPKNAEALANQILAIFKKHGKPIILIGHSMGGAIALYTVLTHPILMTSGMIDKVVIIQGAIGGSPYAENLKDTLFFSSIKKYLGEGLNSLHRRESKKNFEHAFNYFVNFLKDLYGSALFSDEMIKLSNRIFYVRSYFNKKQGSLSWGVRVVQSFCKKNTKPDFENDGLVNIDDQILSLDDQQLESLNIQPDQLPSLETHSYNKKNQKVFGIDLGKLVADHIELVVSGMVSHSTIASREALTRALLQSIYPFSADPAPSKAPSKKDLIEVNPIF